jgi:hypothetical protein
MAQAFGAIVGQQLDRRVAQFAATLVRIGLASFLYAGSVAAIDRRFRCQIDLGNVSGFV